MPRLISALLLSLFAALPVLGQGTAPKRLSAKVLGAQLQVSPDWATSERVIAQIASLGRAGRPALGALFLKYADALGEPSESVELKPMREAIASIGANEPTYGLSGKRVVWCLDKQSLRLAIKELLRLAPDDEVTALLAIPGVRWDVAAAVNAKGEMFDAAVVGLTDKATAATWSRVLRSTFGERSEESILRIKSRCKALSKQMEARTSLFLRISFWGYKVGGPLRKLTDSRYPPELVEKSAFGDLVASPFPWEREAAAFLLGSTSLFGRDTQWLLALMNDKDALVRDTAVWSVGHLMYDDVEVPFLAKGVPGGAATEPNIPAVYGGRFGGRPTKPTRNNIQQAEYLAELHEQPRPYGKPGAPSCEWSQETQDKYKQGLDKLVEKGGLTATLYWALSRFPDKGDAYLERVEADYLAATDGLYDAKDWSWRGLVRLAGGPTRETAIVAFASFRAPADEMVPTGLLSFVLPVANREAQELVAGRFGGEEQPSLHLLRHFHYIEGALAKHVIALVREEGSRAFSFLARTEGGREELVRLLQDKDQVRRLTALIVLARIGQEAKFATAAVQQMLAAATDEKEIEYIRERWLGATRVVLD